MGRYKYSNRFVFSSTITNLDKAKCFIIYITFDFKSRLVHCFQQTDFKINDYILKSI